MKQTFFEGKNCSAAYHPEKMRIYFYSDSFIPEEHKQMYLTASEFLKTNQVVAFVHDLRYMEGSFTILNDWIVKTFRPAVALGLKYSAVILSDDAYTAISVSDMIKRTTVLEARIFKSTLEADNWLDSHL